MTSTNQFMYVHEEMHEQRRNLSFKKIREKLKGRHFCAYLNVVYLNSALDNPCVQDFILNFTCISKTKQYNLNSQQRINMFLTVMTAALSFLVLSFILCSAVLENTSRHSELFKQKGQVEV